MLLLNACSTAPDNATTSPPDPTDAPAPTATSVPTEEPTPTEVPLPTDAPPVEEDTSLAEEEAPACPVDPDSKAGTDITIELPEGNIENGMKISRR